MTALEQLNAYLRRLELRLRLFAASRGVALVASLALALTTLLVWIGNRWQFAGRVVLPLRILLFLSLAAAVSFLLAIPLLKLNRRRIVRLAEHRIPDFGERLLTIAERPDPANPFSELVAEDALRVAREHQPEQFTPTRFLFGFFGSAAVAGAILLWLISAGPGYWGYGASLLWTGSASAASRPLYDIAVQPGNKTIRRASDQAITAQLIGFSARKVTLHAKYGSALKWEAIPMSPKPDGNAYRFLFAGLSDPVEYYVEADSARSRHYLLAVKDLPAVKRVRVALHFPPSLGLKDVIQDPGGDVRAVEGSQADISILTDKPLAHGLLVLENGSKLQLAHGGGNWLTARLPIQHDGSYHVAALDNGDPIRISGDYFIEARKDELPSVKILRPGGDPHVSPIEELPVTVDASDDFGVKVLELHYSVNGGPEQVVALLKKTVDAGGVKQAQAATTLYFENFKVVPGDLVSFYATARDASATSHTDIVFAQAEPFDFKFTQSQQSGGMGAGNSDEEISVRQKQIIAATWNDLRDNHKDRAAIQEDARFLSDLEAKLGDQAKTLADRMASRELDSASSDFEELSKTMRQASSEMANAVGELTSAHWKNALPPEQKALQALLRVEAKFRDIQVAFGGSNGGGMGGGAQRDLSRMFDLELDTTKNQYETGQSAESSANTQQKAIDDAFERLKMLAGRQQELAAQNAQQQPFEQRWQEEQLRRQAEELRQQMQQLAQSSPAGQPGSQQNDSSSSSSQSPSRRGQTANGGRPSSSDRQNREMMEAMRQTANALQRAEDEMRKAVGDRDPAARERAASQLAEAQKLLEDALHRQAGNSVSDLAQRAQEMAQTQREIANRMKQIYGDRALRGRTGSESSATLGGDTEMPEMDDPTAPRFGYYRRRLWPEPIEPTRPATAQEKALANEKEKLARQVEELEKKMQQQEQSMAGAQPDASSKLRKALSDAEQKELALRMQKNAEWLREGYGGRNLETEDSVTAALEQLSRQLSDVQQALKSGDQPDRAGSGDKTARALSDVRALREELEQRAEQSTGQRASQPNGASSPGDSNPAIVGRGVNDTIRELSGLRSQIDPHDRALHGSIDGALWNLQHLTGAAPGVLDATIGQDAVASLERLEVELSKRAGQQATGARTGAPESSPEQYRDAVAEYFKKLSK